MRVFFSYSMSTEEKKNVLSKLPRREHFLEPAAVARQEALLKEGAPIKFLPNDVMEVTKNNESQLILFGIMPDGMKTALTLRGFRPFFDIRVPNRDNPLEFSQIILNTIRSEKIIVPECKIINARPFVGYKEHPIPFVRVFFNTVNDRKRALMFIKDYDFGGTRLETASNDLTAHYRKLAREYRFYLCGWNEVSDYIVESSEFVKPRVRTITAEISKIKPVKEVTDPELLYDKSLVMSFDLETHSPVKGEVPGINDVFDKQGREHSVIFMDAMVFNWQYSKDPLVTINVTTMPVPVPNENEIVVQCDNQVSLIVAKAYILERMCPDFVAEFNGGSYDWPFIIKRAAEYEAKVKNLPLLTMLRRHSTMAKWNDKTAKFLIRGPSQKDIKIDADTMVSSTYFDVPGFICIDVRTIFRKRNNTAEQSSLNYFLKTNKLGLKKDIAYHKMATCYETIMRLSREQGTRVFEEIKMDDTTRKYVPRIVEYCNYDALSCQLLMQVCNIIMDKRELGCISYTSMADTIYFADGMRVRNFLYAAGHKPKWNIVFNTISTRGKDDRKYPGAYILPAKKGLYRDHRFVKLRRRIPGDFTLKDLDIVRDPDFAKRHPQLVYNGQLDPDTADTSDRPCAGLDVQSMYPNIIATYNVSPEKLVTDPQEAKSLQERGVRLCMADFPYGPKNVPDSHKERVRAWVVQHNNDLSKMGLVPQQIRKLFLRRRVTKGKMETYALAREFLLKMQETRPLEFISREELQEAIDKERATRVAAYRENPIPYLESKVKNIETVDAFFKKEWRPELTLLKLFEEITFYKNYYDTKQLGQKVFMNTIYGTLGESASPFFQVGLAGFVTSYGQRLIRTVKRYVEDRSYRVLYGDTDSLYICCPDALFESMDKEYECGRMSRLDYWSNMISTTMVDLNKLKGRVNQYISEFTGASYLRMDYDEVFWPYAMEGKKKYIGVPHVGIVNLRVCMPDCTLEEFMRPGALFIRGLELKKRGSSGFLKHNCFEVFKEAFCIESTRSLRQIVEARLGVVSSLKWEPTMFHKSARYKPRKPGKPGNPTVQNFMVRMQKLADEHPEFGIRPPELGERYVYVIVQRYPWKYDNGHKVKISVADMCEFPEALQNEAYQRYLGTNLKIDIDYYARGELIGQFARFITYHPQFDYADLSNLDETAFDEAYKEADQLAHKNAKKALCDYYNENFALKYECKSAAYRHIAKVANAAIASALPVSAVTTKAVMGDGSKARILESALAQARELPFPDMKVVMRTLKLTPAGLWRVYMNIHRTLRPYLAKKRESILAEMDSVLPAALVESITIDAALSKCIQDIRERTGVDRELPPVQEGGAVPNVECVYCEAPELNGDALECMSNVYTNLVCCLHAIEKINYIEREIDHLKRMQAGNLKAPPGFNLDAADFLKWRERMNRK